jgi:hypothetical protein
MLRRLGWRLLVSPVRLSTEGFPYGLDNGAWSAYKSGEPWDEDAFVVALETLGGDADWVVAPDIVEAGQASLTLSLRWLPVCRARARRVLIAVQDGMAPADVEPHLSDAVGIFVGGSTEWKLAHLDTWCALARKLGTWCHVGRVNTERRIRRCLAAGATSFDGSSVTRYAVTGPRLDAARRQLVMSDVLQMMGGG